MSKPGEMIQILRENYEEQLEAYRLLRNKFLMAVPGMNLDKEKQLYDQWKLDLNLNSIISFDRAIPTSPKPCPEDGCPRDGSAHAGCPCEPRTCETCGNGPQPADVETVRSKIELAIKFGLPIDARIALREALAALDRIAVKEE